MHIPARFILDQGMPQQCFKGCLPFQFSGHGQEGIKPVPELPRKTFCYKITGEPLRPVVSVCIIFKGREGHNTRIQPGVSHILDPGTYQPRLRMLNLNPVDPGAVGGIPIKIVPAFYSQFL